MSTAQQKTKNRRAVSMKIEDGEEVALPKDRDLVSVSAARQGYASTVFLNAVGSGPSERFTVSINAVDGLSDIEADGDIVRAGHVRKKSHVVVVLTAVDD